MSRPKAATTRDAATKLRPQSATPQPSRPQAKQLSVPAAPQQRGRSNSCSLSPPTDPSNSTAGGFTALKVEQLTQEERTSRMLHTGKARLKLQTGMPLVQQLFVVGAPPNRDPPDSYAFSTAESAFPDANDGAGGAEVPKLLFQFPESTDGVAAAAASTVAGLWQFCFPDGRVPQRRVRRNTRRIDAAAAASGGDAAAVPLVETSTRRLHQHHHHHRHHSAGVSEESTVALASHALPENSSVFLITGHTELRYGICVYKEVIAYKTETYFVIEPLCFCAVSPVPFINFHLDALCGILDLPRIAELPTIPPDKLHRLLADAQAAAEVQTPRPPCTPFSPCAPAATPAVVAPIPLPPSPLLSTSHSPPLSTTTSATTTTTPTETQADVDLKKILLTLEQYRKLTVPEESEQLQFFIMTRPRPITVRRPAFDEESELLQSFGSALLFRILPSTVVLQLLTALLLEFKVVLVSPHKRLLTTAVISLMPLLRPYEYQSPIIPILPTALLAYLEAPVPLLVGMTKQPVASTHTEGFYILNLNTCSIQCTKPLLPLPNQQDLLRQLDGLLTALSIPPPSAKGIGAEVPAKLFEQTALGTTQADMISGLFQSYFSGLVRDFQQHCISDVGTDATNTISVFMRESFLATRPTTDEGFMQAFLDTQIFKCFEDRNLRELDRVKTEHRNSLRTRRQQAQHAP